MLRIYGSLLGNGWAWVPVVRTCTVFPNRFGAIVDILFDIVLYSTYYLIYFYMYVYKSNIRGTYLVASR